jgi:hypothetical protein
MRRVTRCWPAAAVLFTLVSAPAVEAQRRSGCREIPWQRPRVGAQVVELQTTEGTFRFRSVNTGRTCRVGGDRLEVGLTDENGRILIHPSFEPTHRPYWRVIPLGSRMALVDAENPRLGARFVYEIGVGERPGLIHVRSPHSPVPGPAGAAEAGAPATGTVIMVLPSGERLEYRDAWTELFADRIVVQARTPDGFTLSRIFTSDGEPLTPVIGRTVVWRSDGLDLSNHVLTETHPFRNAVFDIEMLYHPLGADGAPISLPEGAVGVFPVPNVHRGGWDRTLQSAAGWGVLFAGNGEPVAAIGEGTLDAVLARGDLPRYSGYMQRQLCEENQVGSCLHFFLRRESGQWAALGPNLRPLPFSVAGIPPGGSVADPEASVQQMREWMALPLEERQRRRNAAHWARIQAEPAYLCSPRTDVAALPSEGRERYFRECEVESYTLRSLGNSVSAEALAIATRRDEAYRQQRAEDERRWAQQVFESQVRQAQIANAWDSGLRAAQQAVGASVNRALQGQYDTYRRNLEAYNSGAQRWCCGGVRPPESP